MKGDYYRYIGEYTKGEGNKKVAEAALKAYNDENTGYIIFGTFQIFVYIIIFLNYNNCIYNKK